MSLRTRRNQKFTTKSPSGTVNGYLVPIYNINDNFFEKGQEPQQVYLTVVAAKEAKGPHLHYIRTGYFTCIRGNVKIVVRVDGRYEEYYSGEDHQFLSIEIPTGVAALIQNIGETEAFVLNMPSPAWTPSMNDEHTSDFGDYLGAAE